MSAALLAAGLEAERERWRQSPRVPPGLHYDGPADFVLAEGRRMVCTPRPAEVPPGQPRRCYYNALLVAICLGLPYVEGYAINSSLATVRGAGVDHAWNLDARGRVIDTTWPEQVVPLLGRAYIGIEFSAARADDCSWEGDATILDDRNRGWPLLAAPWPGDEESPGSDLDELLLSIMARYMADGGDVQKGDTAASLAETMRRHYRRGVG